MGADKVKLTVCGEEKFYDKGTPYAVIAEEFQKNYQDDIVLASVNRRVRELHKTVKKDGEVSFITTKDSIGRKAYRRSVTLLMQKALYHLLGKEKSAVRVLHCISQAYYCELPQYGAPDQKLLSDLKEEMMRMAQERLPIYKECIATDEAVKLFGKYGMTEKECLFR